MLVIGGTSRRRFGIAHAFHLRSRITRGPLVCLDAVRDQAALRAGLRAWMDGPYDRSAGPISTAEHGTLLVESVSHLATEAQRLLLAFASRHLNLPEGDSGRSWSGRMIVADGHRLVAALRDGAFSPALYDALDKIRVMLPAVRKRIAPAAWPDHLGCARLSA